MKKKPSINVYGNNYKTKDGTCIRDYIHVSDLAKIHIKILNQMHKKNISGTLNCGYNKGYTVLEIIRAFENFSKKKIKVNFCSRREKDISNIFSRSKALQKVISIKFDYKNLIDIIETSVRWEKKIKKIKKTLNKKI